MVSLTENILEEVQLENYLSVCIQKLVRMINATRRYVEDIFRT